jgi:predicted TIM-barrel fold metal-dependent hydrolase
MRGHNNKFSAEPPKLDTERHPHLRSSRREFMESVLLAGAGAMLSSSPPFSRLLAQRLIAQSAPPAGGAKAGRIDVHYHLTPPSLIQAFGAPRFANAANSANWTIEKTLMDMERNGVAAVMCSIAPQGDPLADPSKAVQLARDCNEYFARLATDHPGRVGIFASLPLPNVDAALREIDYAFGTLKADGIALFTSYGDKWLGDAAFDPVFDELNRRKAVLFTHPNTANCCKNLLANIGDGTIEWGTDTTRAIANLLFSGTAARYANVRMTFSHGGGTMPYLVERFEALAKSPKFASQFPGGFAAAAGKFYYDTAWTTNPEAMSALSKLVPISQILFGTDFPYLTAADQLKDLKDCGVFSAADLEKIENQNALALLPRFRV